MARLNRICWSNTISFASKFKLYMFLVTILLLDCCERWTLLADWNKGSRLLKPSAWGNFSAPPTWSTIPLSDWLGAAQDQLPCRSTGTPSGNCQETETCMVQACQMPQQTLCNHLSGYLGGWAMLWIAEKMQNGQHQRVDLPAHLRTAHKCLLPKTLRQDHCWIIPHVSPHPPTAQLVKGLSWTVKVQVNNYRNISVANCTVYDKTDKMRESFFWSGGRGEEMFVQHINSTYANDLIGYTVHVIQWRQWQKITEFCNKADLDLEALTLLVNTTGHTTEN